MATVMEMPKLSDTMKEGVIARWLVKEGDKVKAGLPIVEIETDKATMEFESPASGVLLKIIVGDKGACALRAPIAVIGKEGENWEETLKGHKPAGGGGHAPAAEASKKESAPAAEKQSTSAPVSAAPASSGRVRVSPLAKKIAKEKGVSLETVSGSGPAGRIVARDLENVSGGGSGLGRPFSAQLGPENERIPLTNMRKTIAARLTESVQNSPHFYLTVKVNVTHLLEWRKAAVAQLSEAQKFSMTDVLVFISSLALLKHRIVNSSWKNDHILQHNRVHMGVAVAVPNGLVTPVIRNAESLTLMQIAAKSKELVKKARDGKMQPPDYEGGTFTISNLGMNGIEQFTAIINPPQAAILAVGAAIPTPVVGKDGQISVQHMMSLTLSCDHRVIDGFVGSEFLKTLKQYLEYPMSVLL